MSRLIVLGILFALFFSAGMATISHAKDRPIPNPPQNSLPRQPSGSFPDERVSLKPTFMAKDIPDVIQMNSYTCGVGVFQAVAMHFGYWGYQEEFAKALGSTSDQGTHPARIVKGLKKLGLEAQLLENLTLETLKEKLREGAVVIIDYQAWNEHPEGKDYAKEWEDGHYSILIGYNDDVLFIEDPSLLGTRGYLTNKDFLARWHDYEIENGKRRDYVHMAIVVKGREVLQPEFTHID